MQRSGPQRLPVPAVMVRFCHINYNVEASDKLTHVLLALIFTFETIIVRHLCIVLVSFVLTAAFNCLLELQICDAASGGLGV